MRNTTPNPTPATTAASAPHGLRDTVTNLGRAIVTRYRPATNTNGARIKAHLADDGKPVASLVMSWNYALDASANHAAAAALLLAKLRDAEPAGRHWREDTSLVGGYLGKGQYAFAVRRNGGAL